jgi:hypothetical protein
MIDRDKRSSLFVYSFNTSEKKIYDIDIWCQCYKTFSQVLYVLGWYARVLDSGEISLPYPLWIRGLYYKTLQIRNLQKLDKFWTKLVSFLLYFTNTQAGWYKHTSLLRNLYSVAGIVCNKLVRVSKRLWSLVRMIVPTIAV